MHAYLTTQDLSEVGVGDESPQESDTVLHSSTGTAETVAALATVTAKQNQ